MIKNRTIDIDTQLIPPAIVTCDVMTKLEARPTSIFIINSTLIIQGIISQKVSYKTFDVYSNVIPATITNEKDFTITHTLKDYTSDTLKEIKHTAISLSASNLSNYLSSIDVYHRVFAHVAFNLKSSILITSTILDCNLDEHIIDNLDIDDSYFPQLNKSFTKNISINLKQSLINYGLSNLNIKRFFIANISRLFSQTILCDCVLLYSFFNNQNELIGSERSHFDLVIDSTTINTTDSYSILGSDILGILESTTSSNGSVLNESLRLIISTQRINE